jgi:hypothetical protein
MAMRTLGIVLPECRTAVLFLDRPPLDPGAERWVRLRDERGYLCPISRASSVSLYLLRMDVQHSRQRDQER